MTKRRIWFLSRVPDEMSVTSTKTFQIGNIIIFHTAANQTYLMQMSKHYTKIILKWVKNELTSVNCVDRFLSIITFELLECQPVSRPKEMALLP